MQLLSLSFVRTVKERSSEVFSYLEDTTLAFACWMSAGVLKDKACSLAINNQVC